MVPFHAALIQALATPCPLDEFKLRLVQLQHVHVKTLPDGTGIEQELMGRDSKKRLRHLPHALLVEIFQVLRRHHQRRVPLAHTLQTVADVLNGHRVRQPQVQLIQHRYGIAARQQPVRHIRQHIEQQGIPQALGRRQHTSHTEHQKTVTGDIGVSVEERCIRPHAQGVQTQQHLLQQLLRIQRTRLVLS